MNSTVGSCPLRWQKKRKGQAKDLDALQPWPILTSRLRKIPIHWWLLGASAYPTKLHSWKWLSLGSIVKIVNWTKQSQGPAVYWGKGFFAEKRHVIEEKLSHGRLAARGRKTSWQKLVSQYSIISYYGRNWHRWYPYSRAQVSCPQRMPPSDCLSRATCPSNAKVTHWHFTWAAPHMPSWDPEPKWRHDLWVPHSPKGNSNGTLWACKNSRLSLLSCLHVVIYIHVSDHEYIYIYLNV